MHLFNLLDVNTPKNARSSRKVEGDKVTLCGAPSSCNVFAFSGRNQAHNLTNILSHECPFKHAAWSPGGVICQGASMLPISY